MFGSLTQHLFSVPELHCFMYEPSNIYRVSQNVVYTAASQTVAHRHVAKAGHFEHLSVNVDACNGLLYY